MNISEYIPSPFIFSPLKHHLHFSCHKLLEARQYELLKNECLLRKIQQIGSNAIDIYIGNLSIPEIINEITRRLSLLQNKNAFINTMETSKKKYLSIQISDSSEWILRIGYKPSRWVHLHPARDSIHCYRTHGNSWKTALMVYYAMLETKNFNTTTENINFIRKKELGLSPIKDIRRAFEIKKCINLITSCYPK